jgi:hypothetical protein
MSKTPDLFSSSGYIAPESEREFQGRVIDLARLNGWSVYSIPDSRRVTLAGYPDLTMWRGKRLVFAELKREKGRLSPAQELILGQLRELPNVEVYVWRPSDWVAIREALDRKNPKK